MSLPNTLTVKFPTTSNGKPKYVINTSTFGTKGVSYFNTGITIKLTSPDYSYLTFDFTFTGTASYVGVSFAADSTISIGPSLDELFVSFKDGTPLDNFDIKLTPGVTKRVYVIVNCDPNKKTSYLDVMISVLLPSGVSPNPNNSLQIDYDCNQPLYAYETGLHVYSPYDAIYSPKLTTMLYSKTAIENWNKNTRVWLNSGFESPAFPYYYGYVPTGYVYKVGGPVDRAYGTKIIYKTETSLWRSIWGKSPTVNTEVTTGRFENQPDDTTDACVNVILSKSGIISEKLDMTLLAVPIKYKYLMGWNSSDKIKSNDDFFIEWLYAEKKGYPITGQQHVTLKLAPGYVRSFKYYEDGVIKGFDLNADGTLPLLIATGVAAAVALASIFLPELMYSFLVHSIFVPGGPFSQWAFQVVLNLVNSSAFGPIGWIILIIGLLYSLFKKKKETLEEICNPFLHEYTTTPYINVGNPLSRTSGMTNIQNGWFCDGVYYYNQSGNVITSKELSYTNALVNKDPITLQYLQSLLVDDPTLVLGVQKLLLLPYTSGIPIDYATPVYYSDYMEITPAYQCIGDLLVLPAILPKVTVPAGFAMSSISKAVANSIASDFMLNTAFLVTTDFNSCISIGETLECNFTHEIRVETYPTTAACFYDNTNNLGLTVGKKLYYDVQGKIKAMNGYYAEINFDSPQYPTLSYPLKFYHTTNGVVDTIYSMANSSSLTVTKISGSGPSTLTVITDKLDYSSNWFLMSFNEYYLASKINTILLPKIFDPNTLYTDSMLVRGYINQNHCDFRLYTDNNSWYSYTTNLIEADSNWYYGIIEWGSNKIFYYQKTQAISIDIQEICLPSGTYNLSLFGFYIIGMTNGQQTAIFNNVELSVKVYKNNNVLAATYTNIITDMYSDKTYFPYDNQILPTDNITNIVISAITPVTQDCPNKITYTVGNFINCNNPTTTTTTTPTVTTTTTTITNACNVSIMYTYVNPTSGNNGTATINIYNGYPMYIFLCSSCPGGGQSIQTSNPSFTITGLAYNITYTVVIYYNTTIATCQPYTINIKLIPPPPTTTTTTTRRPTTTTTTTIRTSTTTTIRTSTTTGPTTTTTTTSVCNLNYTINSINF